MLASLLDVPDEEAKLREWLFQNAEHHQLIQGAIQRQVGKNLPLYVLDPVNMRQFDKWLQDHQAAHTDFNSLLGLQSNDLESVKWDDPIQKRAWGNIHYLEHLAVASVLKI